MLAKQEYELIRRARDGSAVAFGDLVKLYQDRLYRFLLGRAVSSADAEDALQETFVSAFRYLDSYDPRWQFSTWLYRIALRELGKIAGRQQHAGHAHPESAHGDGPLSACIRMDQRQNLWLTARRILGKEAFNVLWLRYAEDMSVKDVAKTMGRPATWVKVVAHRARRKLESEMAGTERRKNGGERDEDGLAESAR